MIELKILHSFCKDKQSFTEYSIYFRNQFDNMEREIKVLFLLIGRYYEKYPDFDKISKEELLTFYSILYPISKNKTIIIELINSIYDTEIHNSLIMDLLRQLKERYFATRIVNKLLPVVEGAKYGVFPTLELDIKEFMASQNLIQEELTQPCTLSVEDLISTVIERDGLEWHMDGVTNILGCVPKKSSGLVFGYVNAGKSAFCISASAGFAKQLRETEELIVYAGNEEAAANGYLRLTEAITGMSAEQIQQAPEKAERVRIENGIHNIKMFDSITTIEQVKQLLDRYGPRVMVVDQATKVKTDSKEKELLATRQLFNEYRELAKLYDTSIIGVTQGDASTADKKWLNLSDLYGSKVAIQGELDYAIGIGWLSDNIAKKAVRYINIPKNKGPMDKFICTFDEETCQWRDI